MEKTVNRKKMVEGFQKKEHLFHSKPSTLFRE